MRSHTSALGCLMAAVLVATTLPAAARAQGASGTTRAPQMDFVMGGMGAFTYTAPLEGPFEHNFAAKLAPILLWNMGSDFLFESHLEFELEDGETQTHLEYAQVDYQGIKNVQLVVGKFLLPFGVFGQRLHPVWIDRLPSFPLPFLDGEQIGVGGRLVPVMSDVGAMAQVAAPLGDDWSLDFSAYVTQGPRAASAEAAGSVSPLASASPNRPAAAPQPAAQTAPDGAEIGHVAIGTNFEDNNKDKMIGGRLGVVGTNGLELYVSGLHSVYDAEGRLAFDGLDLAGWWTHGPYRVRAEGAMLWQQFDGLTQIETLKSPGYYIQASRRIGKFEPVLRWSHVLEKKVAGTAIEPENRQIAEGLDYWFHPNVVAKVAAEQNLDGTDRLLVQLGFGF